eukprot:m.38075 g.38075  ORF g.38075 m.38075 type:complete len:414 (-) comp11150_c0_seq2:1727-2968(-)
MASASDDGVTTPPLPRSLSIPTSPSPSDSPAKQQLPRGSVARIVLTGGPCGGKTTAQSRLSDLFENLGWKVYRAPETATVLLGGGVTFSELSQQQADDFQENLLKAMMTIENTFFDLARQHVDRNCLVICDRGLMDATAFIEPAVWDEMKKRNGWSEVELRDQRYDHVVHLVTAAQGAEAFYSLENNATRSEDVPLAREMDARAQRAWVGHPYYDIIDNSTGFDEKILRVVEAITTRLRVETSDRFAIGSKKRKFLVRNMPETFPVRVQDFEVQHNYIATADESQARIRKRGQDGSFTYTHTVRRVIEDGKTYEQRLQLTAREYQAMLLHSSKEHGTVFKTRRCFTWEHQYHQLDVYQAPYPSARCDGLMLLELYSTNTGDMVLPDFLDIDREVTDMPEFSMFNLAKLHGPDA